MIFVDTSAWLALYNKKDQNHKTAKETAKYLKNKKILLITTDYIFEEAHLGQ